MEVDQILEKIGNSTEIIELASTPGRLFILVAQLQLALRHPGNVGSGAMIARQIADHLTEAIAAKVPEARALIMQGWNTDFDVTREEFNLLYPPTMRGSSAENLMDIDLLYGNIHPYPGSKEIAMNNTDYRKLPDEVKRELIFDALKFTRACVILGNLTNASPEYWAVEISNLALQEVGGMSQRSIDEAIAKIEAARRHQYGVRMDRVEIELDSDDHNPFPRVNQDSPHKPGVEDQF